VEIDAVAVRLRAAGCVFAEEEAAILVSSADSPAALDAMVARRASGEPLEQVVGWAEFCGLRIFVDPGVFVPRRRSEFLVSVAVDFVRSRGTAAEAPVIVDLCCGTGALGLAVAVATYTEFGSSASLVWPALSHPNSVYLDRRAGELHAAELDPVAVACARRNVEPVGGRVYEGNLFGALPGALRGRVNVLICNAPYVPSSEIAFLPAEAREHEAPMALDGGGDGLEILRRVAGAAGEWLAPGGVLLVETSERQAAAMTAAMTAAGLTARVHGDDDWGATVVTGASRQ
jgi:release factor glutamine methyltransferase